MPKKLNEEDQKILDDYLDLVDKEKAEHREKDAKKVTDSIQEEVK